MACVLLCNAVIVFMIDNQSSVPIAKESQGRSLGGRVALSVSLLVWLFAPLLSSAAQITANSVAQKDVASAIAAASDGDTVIIPAGIAYWTNGVAITEKAITIKGAGDNSTIIVDEIPNRSTPVLKVVFTKLSGLFRLTGIQFRGGTTNTGVSAFGIITITGSNFEFGNSSWRVDNCFFNGVKGRPLNIYAWSGLIDTCRFDQKGGSGLSFDGRVPDAENKGHRSWATPVRWGTVDAGVYVENCYITNSVLRAITDGFAGARFVFRYNTCHNVAAENHGTESTGIFRGTRSMEIYGNSFAATMTGEFSVLFRSGTGLVFSNTITGKFPGMLKMVNYRERSVFLPWGIANGLNVWDLNYPTPFDSGTHSGTSGTTVLTASKNWIDDQWVGYHLINTRSGKSGQIQSNTKNTITCYAAMFTADQMTFSAGDGFEIRRIDKSLDMPGSGMGTLLSGGYNTPPAEPTPRGWPNQMDEPIRYWNNNGITDVTNSGYYTIKAGRNYTNAPLPGYTPLIYPHPLVKLSESGGRDGYVAPPSGLQVVPPQ